MIPLIKNIDKKILFSCEKEKYKKRIIFHIDYDSFFASVEQQANPILRNKPIGVTGSSLSKGIICAASIQAKKYGVKTAMPLFKAKQICPNIIPVKGDFTKYQYIHKESLRIFNKYTNLVEPFSIDEAFLDVTQTAELFESPEHIALQIKKDIKEAFGPVITCSIGIGPNKLMAKLVSDFNKPNGLFIVNRENIKKVLGTVELTDFCGIGPKIEKRLNKLGVFNVRDLQKINNESLFREFGNVQTTFLKNLSVGIDYSPVQNIDHRSKPKSIGHQHTLSKNTKSIKIIKDNLRRLSQMVGRRLRNKEMKGKTVGLYLRDSDFKGYYQRITLPKHTENDGVIYKSTEKLMEQLNWYSERNKQLAKKETRLVGVSISNLVQKKDLPYYLFPKEQKMEELIYASDKINDKFGEFTIIPANTILADRTKGKISSFLRH